MKKIIKIRNKIFLIAFSLIILVGFSSFFLEKQGTSVAENRKLVTFPHPTIKTFLKSDYQRRFDKAVADQFVYSRTIRKDMNKLTMIADYRSINKKICKNRYVQINSELATYNCDKRLVYLPIKYSKKNDIHYQEVINDINEAVYPTPIYYYFIDTASNFNFITNQEVYNFDKYFEDGNYAKFGFKDYNEFKKYFYKTDHHWNYNGSYKGYKDIINMLLPGEEIISPEQVIDFKVKFNGSLARQAKISYFADDFKGYKFNYGDHIEYINNQEVNYGKYIDYMNNKIDRRDFINHYGGLYGKDYGEVVYDYENDKENILIIANSYSNAINNLIATHFNKTYIIDPRHYVVTGDKFDFQKYIQRRNISKVLFIGSHTLYGYEEINKYRG